MKNRVAPFKKWLVLPAVLLLFSLFGLGVFAGQEEEDAIPTPDTYVQEIAEALPPEVQELLPQDGSFSEMAKQADTDYLLSLSVSFLKKALSSLTSYLAFFLAVLLLAAVAQRIEGAFGSAGESLSSFLALLIVAFETFSIVFKLLDEVLTYSEKLNSFMLTMSGVMGTVSVLGAGVSQSASTSAMLGATVSLLGGVMSLLLLPVIRISFAASLTSVASSRVNLSSLASFARSFFTVLMGFLSTVSVVAMTFQTMLAQAEDTLAARSIRFAASTSIPIVGGAVSDSVRTLAAAVSLIKRSVGTVGMVGLLILTLYPLSALFSAKIALSISQTAAGILGVRSAEGLLVEVGKIINMLIATVAMLSVLYIFVVALFAGSAVPIG